MSKGCIIDTSSAILLFKGGIFEEVAKHYQIICPPAVISELTKNASYPGAEFFLSECERKRILIEYPENKGMKYAENLHHTTGAGEKECIALFYEDRGDFIILDDKKGAQFCKNNSIPYINALLVPKLLYLSGFISEVTFMEIFSLLLKEGRYSEKVCDYARAMGRDELQDFLPLDEY